MERKPPETAGVVKRQLTIKERKDGVELKFASNDEHPIREQIAGKNPDPASAPATADANAGDPNVDEGKIDYECLPYNDAEALSCLLDTVPISSPPSPTPPPDLPPPLTREIPSEPDCPNPFKTKTDIDIVSALTLLLPMTTDMTAPLFRFDISEAAAQFNWDLLRRNDFDLTGLLNKNKMSVTSFGSEFKQEKNLEMIFGNHHRWKQLRKILTDGVDFPLVELDEKLRRADLAV